MTQDFETELKNTFLEEATQLLSDAEQCFLTLESTPNDPALIDKIFRLAHNLKGSANAVGFSDLGSFTHELETYLLKIKSREIAITGDVVDLLLKSNDQIVLMIRELKLNPATGFDNSSLIAALQGQPTRKLAPVNVGGTVMDECLISNINGLTVFDDDQNQQKDDAVVAATAPRKDTPVNRVAQAPAADESIRVNLQRVDRLLNFIGEMVILQTVLREQAHSSDPTLLRKTINQMGKVTKEVQDLSMGLRMVQVKQTFQKMQRIVRDTSSRLGKNVTLKLQGEETELDKTVLDQLGDPLVHLIRNAVDHGIESSELRKERGKPAQGTIVLSAFHQSGSLIIEVKDDGGGLDAEKLRETAIKRGILKHDAVISDADAYQLIFHSGFSTKTNVSDISGRGVGMDVVKTNIEQIQGEVKLSTTIGQGTTVSIKLPLTLAIIDGMVITSESGRYVIPLNHVHESTRPLKEDIQHVAGLGEVFALRGETLPLYRLDSLLGRGPLREVNIDKNAIAIVVRSFGQAFAVLVDDIVGQYQVVIKQLGSEHQYLKGFGGSAIMGDGKVALILELPELVAKFQKKGGNTPQHQRRVAA